MPKFKKISKLFSIILIKLELNLILQHSLDNTDYGF